MLVTYSALLGSVLAPPSNAGPEVPPDWQRHVEWITVLGQNILAAANDLRPVQVREAADISSVTSSLERSKPYQARENLELMMKRQVELRREETKAIHGSVRLAYIVELI